MDNKTIFVRTLKGEDEVKRRTSSLSGDISRTLLLIDNKSTVDEISKRAAPSLRVVLHDTLKQLWNSGFIQSKDQAASAQAAPVKPVHIMPGNIPKMAVPKISTPAVGVPNNSVGADLDFTMIMRAPTPEILASEVLKSKVSTEAPLQADVEATAKARAEQEVRREAEAARVKAELEAAITRQRLEATKASAEAAAKALAAAETRAKQEAEAKALAQAEAQAARQAAEAGRIKAEQESARLRAEMAAAQARVEAEAKARALAEANARQEAEAKSRREAESARLKVEQEAAQVKAEFEAARAKAEAEARAAAESRAEAETKAKQEAEAARIKAEQEVARAQAEVQAARQEAEAARIRAELETTKLRAEIAATEVRAKAEATARQEAEEKSRREAESARLKAEREAAQAKAEFEVARAKAEAEARTAAEVRSAAESRAKQQAEDARIKAEQEAAQVRAELEATKMEAKVRAEAEEKARQEADAVRLKSEQEAEQAREQAVLEAAKTKVDIKAQDIAEEQRQLASVKENADALARARSDAVAARSMIATVLFFDVVGYTKQSVNKQIELKAQFNKLVSSFIGEIDESQRIILDTGDGAAIGFLQHPEDAIEVAMQFQHAVTANRHKDYPDLNVRMGINLGPVNVVKDMNGQMNMVGDGINDAQRIMSFAPQNQIYISRSCYDVVSRLSSEYAQLFKYRGVQKDKHKREHQLYEVVGKQKEAIVESARQEDSGLFAINFDLIAGKLAAPVSSDDVKAEVFVQEPESGLAPVAEPEAVAPPLIVIPKTQAEIEAEAKAAEELKVRQEAARLKAEAEGRELADEQSKVWSAAEQRAREQAAIQARIEEERVAQEAERAAKASQRVAKKHGKPLPWGKIGGGLFVLLLLLAALLPFVWPMQSYVAQIEKKLAVQLQQPVHVGHMQMALLPHPKLNLQEVTVGSKQELKAGNVELNFAMSALFADSKSLNSVEISDLVLSADAFGQALSWLRMAGGDAQYPVQHMVLQRTSISSEGFTLPVMSGGAEFDAHGGFVKAALNSEDGKLSVELQPIQSRWQVVLAIKDSRLPQLPDILFEELNIKGEVGAGEASFNEIEGRLYRGFLHGNAHLSWKDGWQMQGKVNVNSLELQNALPHINVTGEMEGTANFMLRGNKLSQLGDAPHLEGSFKVSKGSINNIDLVEIVRSASRNSAPGGRTHFDELSGLLQLDNSSQHLRQIRISSGAINAGGNIDVAPNKQLSGQLFVDLKMRAGMGSVPLQLSGKLGEPVLRPGR